MPFDHESLVAILRNHPELVLDRLRTAFGLDVSGDLELGPRAHAHADLVVVLRTRGNPRPRRALVIEVQLQPDPGKRLRWPVYVALTRARLRCPVTLVAITLDVATARWCATPIELDENGSALYPLVIGPPSVPLVDAQSARRHPELAVLSRLAHATDPITCDLDRARSFLDAAHAA